MAVTITATGPTQRRSFVFPDSDATIVATAAAGAVGTILTGGTTPAWSASPTLAVGATGNATFLQATLSDNGAVGHYNFCVGQGANAGDASRADHVLSIGYNTTPAGGRANAAEPAFEWRIEDYYKPTGANALLEAHWAYYDSAGGTFRPIAMQLDRTVGGYLTTSTVMVFTSAATSFISMDGTQTMKIAKNDVQILNSSSVNNYVNNVQGLKQAKVSGSLRSLIYINSADCVVIGDTTGVLDIQWTQPLVSLGGGSAPTLGTIGGTGPATAAQHKWLRVMDSAGAACWIPVWK